jgi:hypothetical protein
MNKKLEAVMYDGAIAQYKKISEMEVGSEEYTKAVQGAGAIVDRLNEIRKIDLENERFKAEKRNRWAQVGTDVGKFVTALAVFTTFNYLMMGFELGNRQCTAVGENAQKKLMNMFNIPRV